MEKVGKKGKTIFIPSFYLVLQKYYPIKTCVQKIIYFHEKWSHESRKYENINVEKYDKIGEK